MHLRIPEATHVPPNNCKLSYFEQLEHQIDNHERLSNALSELGKSAQASIHKGCHNIPVDRIEVDASRFEPDSQSLPLVLERTRARLGRSAE